MTQPNLRIIEATERSADERLRSLFRREGALRAELSRVLAEQKQARNAYAEERGLLMRPSVDTLRKVVM